MVLLFLFFKASHLQIGKNVFLSLPQDNMFKKMMHNPKVHCSSHRADCCTAAITMQLNHKCSHSGLYLLPIKYLIGRVIAVRQPSAQGYYSASCNDFLQSFNLMANFRYDGWRHRARPVHAPVRLWTYTVCPSALRDYTIVTVCGALSSHKSLHLLDHEELKFSIKCQI